MRRGDEICGRLRCVDRERQRELRSATLSRANVQEEARTGRNRSGADGNDRWDQAVASLRVLRYHSTVRRRPSSSDTAGSKPSRRRALEMSACESRTSPARASA